MGQMVSVSGSFRRLVRSLQTWEVKQVVEETKKTTETFCKTEANIHVIKLTVNVACDDSVLSASSVKSFVPPSGRVMVMVPGATILHE